MNNVLFICPAYGNGGILSWAKKLLDTFFRQDFQAITVNSSRRRSTIKRKSNVLRVLDGILDTFSTFHDAQKVLKNNQLDLMHITTSGGAGTLRDYMLVNLCHQYGVPCVLHCHYGCISKDVVSKGFLGWLLRKTLQMYDNIWVLDRISEKALKSDSSLEKKVFITPNPICVPDSCDLSAKCYKTMAFIGNLNPQKGLFELVHAVADYDLDVTLTIAGPAMDDTIQEMKRIAGPSLGTKIDYVGKLPGPEAVELIKSVDILALPSYFTLEAFPISILEAMSYGKIVISTRRAAIPDMLTDIDGNECGCFVKEKSVEDIVDAIKWCQDNPQEADMRCAKAYEKVKACYSTEVVYGLYRNLYKELLNKRSPVFADSK